MSEITAQKLKEYRKARKLTQAEFGKLCGLGKNVIHEIESGKRDIKTSKQILFNSIMYGKEADKPEENTISYSPTEWQEIVIASNREGFHSPEEWIAHKIRIYLAMQQPRTQNSCQLLSQEKAQNAM